MQNLIARDLLSIGAVFLRPDEPFTWASGIKSPIYCDNRLTLTAPAVRNDVENGLAEVIRREWADFIVVRERRGAKVQTPPGNHRPTMSKREILSIRDTAQRQRAIAENHEVFGF